mgnify:CR=1 FL=1
MRVDAKAINVECLKNKFFVVPDYQREYVWERENVEQFLNDIYDEFEANSGDERSNYFIGSIIIVERNDGTFEVIDGQQRLTTIVIALCSFREYLININGSQKLGSDLLELKDELLKTIKELLYEYSLKYKKKIPRLELQYEESKDYLRKLISGEEYNGELTNSIKRMQEAYKIASEFIESLGGQDPEKAIEFIRYFLINVEMVEIKPENISSALKIFETINHRGVGLNPMDLLKNLIFREAKEEDFGKIKEIWKEITKELEGCGEGDRPLRFLRYFLMAKYYDGIIREDEIYDWIISKEGKNKIGYSDKPLEFAKELLTSAKRYSRFVKATTSKEEDEKYPSITRIGYIGKSNFRQHLILLLALNEALGDDAIELLSKQLETLIFYYIVTKEPTKNFERKFSNWAKELRNIKTEEELKKFVKDKFLAEIREREIRFKDMFLRLTQKDLGPLYRTKYILGRIEDHIREACNYPLNGLRHYQTLQLEHILPQTPKNGEIPEEFGSLEEYDSFVRRLGNLTLVEEPINKALNKVNNVIDEGWFNKKLEEYKKSKVFLTYTCLLYTSPSPRDRG